MRVSNSTADSSPSTDLKGCLRNPILVHIQVENIHIINEVDIHGQATDHKSAEK